MSPALASQRVVVTRSAHQAGGLTTAFEAAGARVECLPLIELAPPRDRRALDRTARRAARYDWLVFTSANSVDAFLPLLDGATSGAHPKLRSAAVGPATAGALRRRGLEPAVVAARSRAEGLLEILVPRLARGARVLIPQAEDARRLLADGLRAAGASVTIVVTYRKRLPAAASAIAGRLFGDSKIGWVTCTSPRIARHLATLFGSDWPRRRSELRAISIGPVTSAELRRLGVEPAAEAEAPSDEAMVAATTQAFLRSRG